MEPPAIYPSITVLMEYIALEQLSPFLKPNCLSLVVKKVAYRSIKQCSNIFDSTGLIDIPRKSSTVRHFPIAWPPFGKETVSLRPNADGKQTKMSMMLKSLARTVASAG